MKGIFFELKKLICSKFFIFSTVIMFGVFGYMMISVCSEDYVTAEAAKFSEYVSTLPQPVTDEFLAGLTEKNAAETEEYFSHKADGDSEYTPSEFYDAEKAFLAQTAYAKRYAEDMTGYVKENLRLKNQSGSESEKAAYQKVIDIYNRPVEISIIDNFSFENYYSQIHRNTSWASVLFGPIAIVWAALLTAYLLCCERQSGTDGLMYSSRRGRSAVYLKKLCAVTVTVLAAAAVMLSVDMLCGAVFYKTDFSASVQSAEMFEYCQYKLNFFGLYALTYAMMFCAMMTGVFIASLFSVRAAYPIRGITAGIVLGIASWQIIGGIRYLLQTSPGMEGVENTIRIFFPPYLTDPLKYLSGFDYFVIFGIPISRLAAVFLITLLLGAVSTAVCAKLYGRSSDIQWKAKFSSLIKSLKHTAA